MCTCEEIERGTHAHRASKLGPSNDSGLRIVNWESQSKTPESRRRTHLLYFTYCVLHCVTCQKTCHPTACLTSLWTSISVFYVNTARDVVTVCLYWLNIHHFTYTFSHAHTEADTHKHTYIISTQENCRQPDTGALLRGVEEKLC